MILNQTTALLLIPTKMFEKFAQDVALKIWDATLRRDSPADGIENAVLAIGVHRSKSGELSYSIIPQRVDENYDTRDEMKERMHEAVREIAKSDNMIVALFVVAPVHVVKVEDTEEKPIGNISYVSIQGATVDMRTYMILIRSESEEVFIPDKILMPEDHNTNTDAQMLAELWLTLAQEHNRRRNIIMH